MTIRRRFSLSFLGIVTLFAFNIAVYTWTNQRRAAAVSDLMNAISRESLISSVQLTMNDAQKQVSLLSQVATEAGSAGASDAEKAQFNSQLDSARKNVAELRRLSGGAESGATEEFAKATRELTNSWQIFYDNFGVNQTKAIAELAVRGDPLSRRVMQELMPKVQADQNRQVSEAGAAFDTAARISDRVTFAIFIISTIVAMVLAYLVSRDITGGLAELKTGAAALGKGQLHYRIGLQRDDELGALATAFNDMAGHLAEARAESTRAHDEEKRRGEELAQALDQLKKAQDQLVTQQKLASLGSLTAGIAHEIKNPLNFVTNFSSIAKDLVGEIRQALTDSKEQIAAKDYRYIEEVLGDLEQSVTKIREHGARADGIVKGMLMHSRGQRGQRQPTNINSLVSEYVKLAYHGMRAQDINFNVTIEEKYDESIPQLDVVPHDLSRVILNVANNGCYSAYAKSKRAGADFRPTLTVRTERRGGFVDIRIRDNGDGIPKDIRQKIFEPFFTTKPAGSGTGLGLSMSYDIVVQEHKGQLQVDSQPGEFAEFLISLPAFNGVQDSRS